jgi:hypothetical protein
MTCPASTRLRTDHSGEEAAAMRMKRVILWVTLSIIVGVILAVGIFWIWAAVTGGKYM